jgi:hypothetical protein
MRTYEIYKNEQFLTFESDHGECYGGIRKTVLDCEGKKGKKLYEHIKEYVGLDPANAAKAQGFCANN